MSTTYVAKLVYGVKESLAEFYCKQDKIDLKNDCEINNVNYYYNLGVFGVELESSEEGDLTKVNLDTFMREHSVADVIKNHEECKIYLCVDSY
tara:strand:- start:106723 stop:107001 length:279 start_codon:yes stop_codon:yes gene_type:complete